MPNNVIVQQYFRKKRVLASGIALLGVSIGYIAGGPLTQFLLDMYGWRGTLIILAGLTLHNFLIGFLFRALPQPKKTRAKCHQRTDQQVIENHAVDHDERHYPSGAIQQLCKIFTDRLCDFTIFKNPCYILYLVGTFMMAQGLTAFNTHTPSRAVVYGVDRDSAALLLSYGSVMALAARLVTSFVANMPCVNIIYLYSVGTILAGAVFILNSLAVTFPTMLACVLVLGFLNGE